MYRPSQQFSTSPFATPQPPQHREHGRLNEPINRVGSTILNPQLQQHNGTRRSPNASYNQPRSLPICFSRIQRQPLGRLNEGNYSDPAPNKRKRCPMEQSGEPCHLDKRNCMEDVRFNRGAQIVCTGHVHGGPPLAPIYATMSNPGTFQILKPSSRCLANRQHQAAGLIFKDCIVNELDDSDDEMDY